VREGDAAQRCILLDACCVLNLYATGRMAEILTTIPAAFQIVEAVHREALYIRGRGGDTSQNEPVDLQPLIDAGILSVAILETEAETNSYIDFGNSLDDGEAMTCAIAVHRTYTIATDERKATRMLAEVASHLTIITTSAILKEWVETRAITADDVSQILADIRDRARFEPGARDPLQTWWRRH
jgi:predicted nucleic acid-binding protein